MQLRAQLRRRVGGLLFATTLFTDTFKVSLQSICAQVSKVTCEKRATDLSQLLYTTSHASEIAKRTETHARASPRSATCSFTMTQQGAALEPPTNFGLPLGHPNSLKIAPAPAVCAKVRARAPLNANKRTFGGPRVPKGAKM